MSTWRLTIAIVLVATTAAVASAARGPAAAVPSTMEVPYTLSDWHGTDAEPAPGEEDSAVVADQILNRTYSTAEGDQAGLYVAYYANQRPGVSIHSPLHCLPGTGWDVLSNQIVPVTIDGAEGRVRRLVARKESARIIVLYWYDIHGRMIASDLLSRVQLFSDRLRLGRNDATLVRLVIPVSDSEAAADAQGQNFMRALVPHL